MRTAVIRIHGSANELLAPSRRGESFTVDFELPCGLRDVIQATGVPHVELGEVRINGAAADYSARVDGGDEIEAWSLYPLRLPPAEPPAFLLDGHLGRLAHYLRLFGFDTEHDPEATDSDLAEESVRRHRVLLTRDRGLLMRSGLENASFVRRQDPRAQIVEVLHRFALKSLIRPLSRCLECNGLLEAIPASEALAHVPPSVAETHHEFSRCGSCRRIYWKGSHYLRLLELVEQTVDELAET